nr:tyrosine-type recombinase/integrase [Maliibacterium massiliense]
MAKRTTMRRANGTGSVYKLSGKRRKPWAARITKDWEDGRQEKRLLGTYRTRAEAEEALAQHRIHPIAEDGNITLKALFEQWQEMPAYTRLDTSTKNNYLAAFRKYMVDYHHVPFAQLRVPAFQAMVARAQTMGMGLSTMEKIKSLSVTLGKYAYTLDITQKVYATSVVLPRAVKKKISIFTDMDLQKLFAADDLPYVDTILIFTYTGMRISELLKLTRFDVDIEEMLITGGVKTDAGKDRIIPIHPRIQGYVRARYERCNNFLVEKVRATGSKKQGTYREEIVPISPDYYRDYIYYPLLAQLGIEKKNPHKARHTFFSRMDARCDDKVAMAEIGGHTDPRFSEKVYVHPDVQRLRRAIETLP